MKKLPVSPPVSPCTLCELGTQRHVGTWGNCISARWADRVETVVGRPRKCKYLLVGQAPGREENLAGSPFVGASGQLLTRALETLAEAGLDLSTVVLTNAVRCMPADDAPPTLKQQRACRAYLEEEIAILKPELIVALGGSAFAAMCDSRSASVIANRLQLHNFEGVPLGVTFHPAAALRNPIWRRELLADLDYFLRLEGWKETGGSPTPFKLASSAEDVQALWGTLLNRGHLVRACLDIETDGLFGEILTVAIMPDRKRAQPTVLNIGMSLEESWSLQAASEASELLVELLEDSGVTLVGHNLKYDIRCLLQQNGLQVPRVRAVDTMVLYGLMDEAAPNRSLDYLAKRYGCAHKGDIDRTRLKEYPLNEVAKYNAQDVVVTLELERALRNEIASRGQNIQPIEEVMSRAIPFIALCEAAGVAIDQEALRGLDSALAKKQRALERKLTMGLEINLASSLQVSKHLYQTLGLRPPKIKGAKTKTGMLSTREDIIRHLDHPWPKALLEYRATSKMRSSYVTSFMDRIQDGMVYPEYYIVKSEEGGTVTGRLSARKPAIQTLPVKKFRNIVVSRYRQGNLVYIDAAQLELRVAAWLTQCEHLLHLFRVGKDLHQATADACGVSRSVGKNVNFGSIYGVSVPGLVEKMGLPVEVANRVYQVLRKDWHELYAGLERFVDQGTTYGYVETPFGRRRHFPVPDWKSTNEMLNFPVQSTASDIVLYLGALLLHDDFLPVVSIHDGLLYDIPPGNLRGFLVHATETIKLLVPKLHEIGVEINVPLDFDIAVGKSWGQMKKRKVVRSNV